MRSGRLAVVLLAPILITAAACSSSKTPSTSTSSSPAAARGTLVVASAGFTESNLLADMYKLLLQKAGYTVRLTQAASSEVLDPALEHGQIDVVPEYAATYADVLQTQETGTQNPTAGSPSLSATVAALTRLAARVGLTPLAPSSAVDQNAFAVAASYATAHHLSTLSDLGRSGLRVTIAGPSECSTRPFCAPGLERVYGIRVKGVDPLGFDSLAGKQAVARGTDQVAEVATTDATVSSFHLVVLTDDKHLQNADNVIPIVYHKALTPQIESALDGLSRVLTTSALGQLDAAVDVQRIPVDTVARGYLQHVGLL